MAQVNCCQRYIDRRIAVKIALLRAEVNRKSIAALTHRERQVLDLLAESKSYHVAADELGICYKTITNISYSPRRKLNVDKGLPDLIRKALELTHPRG